MKKILEIYDNTKTYLYPNMNLATPESVAATYTAVNIPNLECVIETDESRMMFYTAPEPITILRSRYNINSSVSTKDAIVAIEEILNAPQPEAELAPTAEERIAAALEYQNLLSI